MCGNGTGAHLAAWKSSGLSQAAYCRQHGLTQNDFSRWKREVSRRDNNAQPAIPAAAFVPVRVTGMQAPGYPFERELRGGRVLRFDARADMTVLRSVLAALGEERSGC